MPCVGVESQNGNGVVQAACIGEHGDAAQQGVAHEKAQKRAAHAWTADPWQQEQDVHGDAAELERKIPPVVMPVSQDKSQD